MKTRIALCATLFSCQFCIAQNNLTAENNHTNLNQSTPVIITAPSANLTTPKAYPGNTYPYAEDLSRPSPYKTGFVKDGFVITGAVGITLVGYELIKNKSGLTNEELAGKTKDKLPFFDRGNAGYYSAQANKNSYILFDAAYAIPLLTMLVDGKERTKAGQIIVLYVETIGLTGAMYTITAGLVYRSRPFVYGTKAPLDKRLDKGGQRSFYGGHVATTAAATFLTAKIFSDFNPGSKLRPYLWTAATGLTALMGYMRYEAGYHFLSDCVVSGIIGAATGILIPDLHKNKKLRNMTLAPTVIYGNSGISLTYHLK